ncbi:MAG: trypsin-like serine protease [Rhizobiales bacterium]|nr:trypsin-like serine protease [Hyphomicrobiales bacterium]
MRRGQTGISRISAIMLGGGDGPGEPPVGGDGMSRAILSLLVVIAFTVPGRADPSPAAPRGDFGRIVLSDRQSVAGAVSLEANIGAYNNELISSYGPQTSFVRLGRAVGRLDVLTDAGVFPCTAFIVSERYLLTNHHCVPGIVDIPGANAKRIDAVQFVAGYTVEGVTDGAKAYTVSPIPVETDRTLDYSLLEVFGNPSAEYGLIGLSAPDPLPESYALWIIGHPLKGAQRISREQCKSGAPAIADGKLRHTCDTLPGNSGSPVIDPETRTAVALHHAGSQRDSINFAIPLSRIMRHSTIISGLVEEHRKASGASGAPAATPPAPAGTAGNSRSVDAITVWESLKESRSRAALERFVRDYPDTVQAALASERLATLEAGGAGGQVASAPATSGTTAPPAANAAPPASAPRALAGRYTSSGRNPDGSRYTGTAVITENGGLVRITWYIANDVFRGTGRWRNDQLVVDWGAATPVIYDLGPDGVLRGTYAGGAASDVLRPR